MPLSIPAELQPLIVPRAEPVALEGTSKQVAYATAVRRSMLAVLRRSAPPDVLDLLRSVKDSTWWLGNRNKPLDAIRWPSPGQMSPPDGEPASPPVGYAMAEKQNATGGTVATANLRWSGDGCTSRARPNT